MENEKSYNIILLIIFLIVLYVPTISYFFVKDNIKVENNENRELATKPEFSFKNLSKYPKEFDLYYNDNLPYRNYIVNKMRTIYYNIFNESIDERIIIGKNESNETWLFYDNLKDNDEISFIDGRKEVKNEVVDETAEIIIDQTEKLKEKNIELYYIIAPNKSSVYSEYLPKTIKVKEDYFEKIYIMLKNKKIDNIYYDLNLMKDAKNNYETYYRTDTHWTDYGAYVYVKNIMNNIYDKQLYENEEIKEEFVESFGRDLHNYLGVSFKIKDTITTINYSNKAEITPKIIKKEYGNIEIYENNNYKLDEIALIVGDSFSNRSTKFFYSMYKKVIRVYLNNTRYEYSILDEFKPDKIFYIRNERFMPNGLNFKFIN